MTRRRIPATFIRGGTSKGVFFHKRDLPEDREQCDRIFLQVMGSPDRYQRQLDGLGGGLSSLSKVAIIAPSSRHDADIEYTFAQVAINAPIVDYGATCGNLSSAVGPFAVDEGLIEVANGDAVVRVFNTNTSKIYHARFPVKNGQAVETGSFVIPGVSGSGARIRLDYLDPGGAATSSLLPSGNVRDRIHVEGLGEIEISFVDATNAVVFVRASDLDCQGTESPEALDANKESMMRLDAIRRLGGVIMNLAERPEDIALTNPKVAIISAASDFTTLAGETVCAHEYDIGIRIVSMGAMHRAVTLTGAMCLAAACKIEGTITHSLMRHRSASEDIRIGNPSGVLPVGADIVRIGSNEWCANSVWVYRTQRRLMEGCVLLP